MPDPSNEQLLAEFDDLIRSAPEWGSLGDHNAESISWLGRTAALMGQWSIPNSIFSGSAITDIQSGLQQQSYNGYKKLMTLIHQARHDLLLKTGASRGVAVAAEKPHEYFDGVRKVVETATSELFVVDPYLNADFVSDYLPYLKQGVSVQLLASKYVDQLVPAVKKFVSQNGAQIAVRADKKMHDRYMFIDGRQGYQSSASFKDGGKSTPAQFTEFNDVFAQILSIYKEKWEVAEVLV